MLSVSDFTYAAPWKGFVYDAPRLRSRTVYGWLPRDKGVCDLRQLVGHGHVFGVRIAVCPRALMNVRVRLGSLSMARAFCAPVRTGCPCLVSAGLPSSRFALAISIRPVAARNSMPSHRPPGLAGSQHGPDGPRHAVGQRDGRDRQRLFPRHPPKPVLARIGAFAGRDHPHRAETEQCSVPASGGSGRG